MSMDKPAPLVPAEVDLRDFGYMPLDALRLRDSDLSIEASAEVFRASVLLWCASWHQVPAGSLPDKDKTLAEYSRSGARWPRIRGEVLSRWVLCSDGRLYHPVVSEKAREAQAAKLAQRARTRAATEAREAKRRQQQPQHDEERNGQRDEQRDEQRDVERDVERDEVQGKGREGKGIVEPSVLVASKPRPTKKAPPDFALTPELRSWAAEKAPLVSPDAELAKMLDHTFATARTDWPGTMRNWLRKAQEDAASRGRGRQPGAEVTDLQAMFRRGAA